MSLKPASGHSWEWRRAAGTGSRSHPGQPPAAHRGSRRFRLAGRPEDLKLFLGEAGSKDLGDAFLRDEADFGKPREQGEEGGPRQVCGEPLLGAHAAGPLHHLDTVRAQFLDWRAELPVAVGEQEGRVAELAQCQRAPGGLGAASVRDGYAANPSNWPP